MGKNPDMFANYKMSARAMKYFLLAYEQQMAGELEAAIVNYRKSLAVERSAEAFTFLGWTYSFQGKLAEAIAQCHNAIAVDPEFGNPYNDIGAYYLQMGKAKEAGPWLEKAKKAGRYDTPEYACCNLGRVYELRGLWPLAMREYQEALNIREDYLPAEAAFLRLQILLN